MSHEPGAELTPVGTGLHRPECVLATARGDLFVSDSRGGVAHLRPDGTQALYTGYCGDLDGAAMPNGIAAEPDGSFLLAHLGAAQGGVFRLRRDGELTPVLQRVDGAELPPTNYVTRDRRGRLWVTVSTRRRPRQDDYRPDAASGFVVLADDRGARIVADGLGYANECALDTDGRYLYVNETFARRLTRFAVRADGDLGPGTVVAEFGPGEFPDGLALDTEGGVWVTCIVGNRVLRVEADGRVSAWVDAGDPDRIGVVERAFQAGRMTGAHIAEAGVFRPGHLGHCSSIAFGGPHRRRAYLGSLLNDHLTGFDVPVAGVEPIHWRYGA